MTQCRLMNASQSLDEWRVNDRNLMRLELLEAINGVSDDLWAILMFKVIAIKHFGDVLIHVISEAI